MGLLEFAGWSSLVSAYTSGGDFGHKVIFRPHRDSGKAAQDIDLSHVSQRVGNRPF